MPDILQMSLADFLAATAARHPTPGGGSVTALCGALAASLATMALHYTAGKKKFSAHEPEIQAALAELKTAATLFQELIAEDIAAYEALAPLLKLPPESRHATPDYPALVVASIRAPQTVAALAAAVLERCLSLLHKTNPLLLSDLGIAAILANAAVHASELNVRVNLPLLENQTEADALANNLHHLAAKADETANTIRAHLLKTL